MTFAKLVAVTAVAACAGGGILISGGGTSGASPSPAVLDHYLCAPHLRAGTCDPVKETLPDATTFTVSDPTGLLACRGAEHHRRRSDGAPTSALISNELTSAPVALTVGHARAACDIVRPMQAGAIHPHADQPALLTCYSVDYPPDSAARFAPPFPVVVNDTTTVRVKDPFRLCIPNDPLGVSGPNNDLLCFHAEVVDLQTRHHRDHSAVLCVPSSDPTGTTVPPEVTTTTSTLPAPTTTAATTTTTAATTTTTPATTTTTTTAGTTTTTVRPPTSQPCAGTFVNGICTING